MDVFLLLIYALDKLQCVPLTWYVKIYSNQFTNINKIYNNLGSEKSGNFSRWDISAVL